MPEQSDYDSSDRRPLDVSECNHRREFGVMNFKRDDKWRTFYRTALILSLIVLAGFVATFVSFVTQSGFLGLTQRFTLAALVTWMLLRAARLPTIS
jgi:uncharacterized membrane protein YjgN (DUF898 family)